MARRGRSPSARNLLSRPPVLTELSPPAQGVVDLVDQLEELAALRERGVLSPTEFERQKRKVLDA